MKTETKQALSRIDDRAGYYEAIANEIWENPELSLKEFKAAALFDGISTLF